MRAPDTPSRFLPLNESEQFAYANSSAKPEGRAPECDNTFTQGIDLDEALSRRYYSVRMRTNYPDPVADVDRPYSLLSTNEHADFARNFREMEKYAKRPYSLIRVLRSFCQTPPKLDGFEMEVSPRADELEQGVERNRSAGPNRGLIELAARPDDSWTAKKTAKEPSCAMFVG